jgi:hypothetical protein
MNIPNKNHSNDVISWLTLRQMIGWIGLLMPFTVRLGAFVFESVHTNGSISAYYYTGMRDTFVSTLVLVGSLLACYRTDKWHDNLIAIIAGVAAIGIGLFPMDPSYAAEIIQKYPDIASAKCYLNRGLLGYHSIFVAIFFSLVFYQVYFRFGVITTNPPTREKLFRNKIYKVCGIFMLIAFLAIGFIAFTGKGESIFWPETVAVVAFGVAWLVKGRTVFKDSVA